MIKKQWIPAAVVLAVALGSIAAAVQDKKPGYTDTPVIPGSKYKVHDADRPRPKVIKPAEPSTQSKPGAPPSDAIVLFDGTDLSNWSDGKGNPSGWVVKDGYMEVPPKKTPGGGTIKTKEQFGDCQLHIEWSSPAEVKGSSQGRGNSGVYLMGRFEVQVLDSYDNVTYADGQAGAMYGQYPPLVNACRKPGEWQTYDIIFKAPRFKDGKLESPARVTVIHNGVVLHHNQAYQGPSSHRRLAKYSPMPEKGPIQLQDHGNPVRFRNIWIRSLGKYE